MLCALLFSFFIELVFGLTLRSLVLDPSFYAASLNRPSRGVVQAESYVCAETLELRFDPFRLGHLVDGVKGTHTIAVSENFMAVFTDFRDHCPSRIFSMVTK
jgi:hypothetical protein